MTSDLLTNKEKPKISIIIVVFNGEKTIEEAIKSVINQSYLNIEFIIVDGFSTDNTKSIIEKYKGKITYFSSEPDDGIYDAMNKGISKSTGDWIYFLGADDRLISSSIIKSIFDVDKEALDRYFLIFGNVIFEDDEYFISKLDSSIYLGNTVHHQGAFYKRCLFDSFAYDKNNSIYSDYELNLIIYLSRFPILKIDDLVARCSKNGISGRYVNTMKYEHQKMQIRNRNLSLLRASFFNLLSLKNYLKIRLRNIAKDAQAR